LSNADFGSLALDAFGIPFRYLSDNIPCASGEKAIVPTPSLIKFLSKSFSNHLFIKE
jgi:hypothetical protein